MSIKKYQNVLKLRKIEIFTQIYKVFLVLSGCFISKKKAALSVLSKVF